VVLVEVSSFLAEFPQEVKIRAIKIKLVIVRIFIITSFYLNKRWFKRYAVLQFGIAFITKHINQRNCFIVISYP